MNERELMKRVSVVLVAVLLINPVAGVFAASDRAGAAVLGAMSVSSGPAGAAVYVDGDFAGRTPLHLAALPVGDHRVRVEKRGYLENARIVSVIAGFPKRVDVVLTKYAANAVASPSAPTGGGSILTSPLFLIAVAGGAVAAFVLLKGSKAPVPGTVTPSATVGIAGMNVTFTSTGASTSSGTLTYAWDFGDGGTGTGASATHLYSAAGTYTVKVTVSNGSKSAVATLAFTVKTLTATWQGNLIGVGLKVVMTQTGTQLSGTWTDDFGFVAPIAGNVAATAPTVTFTVTFSGGVAPITMTGNMSSDGNTITGVGNGAGVVNGPFTLARQ